MTSIMKFSSQHFLNNNVLPIAPQVESKKHSIIHIKPFFNSVKKGWEYTDSILGLARNVMNIILENCNHTCTWISKKTNRVIQKTYLYKDALSVVYIPGKIASIPSKIQKIWESIHWQDREGAILATMSFTLFAANMFDTITSLINTTLEILSKKTVGWISKMGLPLAISLMGADMTLETKSFYHRYKFQREFSREIIQKVQKLEKEKLFGIIAPFLHKHLGEDVDVANNTSLLKEKVLERKTSKKVVLQFKKLKEILKDNHNNAEDREQNILTQMHTIEKLLKDEERSQAISMVSSTITLIAVSLFFYPPASVVSYSLLAILATIELGKKIQEDLDN